FKHLAIPEITAIKASNRYNMDETGILEGRGSNGLVLGSSETRSIRKKQPGSRAWTSLIECISATGNALPPLVIYKGKSVQQQWFPLELMPYESWKFTATENGWTSDSTAVKWLTEVFIPSTQPRDPSEVRLLILDDYGSYKTTAFMYACFTNKIPLLFLLAYTMAKPLMSPLLLENISTPAKPAGQVCKGVSDGKRKIEALQAEVDASRARKRKKVKMSLNLKFADIEAIWRAQIEAGELESSTDESSESENPSDSERCIVVAS
ncbi:hypothetical protein K456DRAFT_53766, partial [Colletotrichum gloeosporioides 23]